MLIEEATSMFLKKTMNDIDVQGKRVFVRVDFNVPMENGECG